METDSGAGCQPQGPTRFTWLSTHTVFPGSDTGRCYLAQLPAVSRATGSTLDKSRFPRTGRASWEHLSFHVQLLGPSNIRAPVLRGTLHRHNCAPGVSRGTRVA